MSSHQKALKIVSIVLIAIGVLGFIGGVFFIAMGSSNASIMKEVVTEQDGVAITYSMGSYVIGALLAISGIIEFVVGIFGLRGAKDPAKVGAFYILAIIGVIYEVISFAFSCYTYANGGLDTSTLLIRAASVIFMGVCFWLAAKVKREA